MDSNDSVQQRRYRGFWQKLKNPKTLMFVFWCVRWMVRIIKLIKKLNGEDEDFFD